MNKTAQAVISDAIGYTYEWTTTLSSCSSPTIGLLSSGTITSNPQILSQNVVTTPDDCDIVLQLLIIGTDNTVCEHLTYDLNTNNVEDYHHWECVYLNDGYACNEVAGLPLNSNHFNTYEDCIACQTCICNPNNIDIPCPCIVDVSYTCNNGTMYVTNNSVSPLCTSITIGAIYKDDELLYSGNNSGLIIGNSIAFPVNLPNGSYYISVDFVATNMIGEPCNYTETILVNCDYGETSNIACCTPIVNGLNNNNIGNVNGLDLYIMDISSINPLQDIIIDFGYNTIADQIMVYSGVKSVTDVINNPTIDLVASTPPCGDLVSCHNNIPCSTNIIGDVVEGFWTGNGIYDIGLNAGISNQTLAIRDNLVPTWSTSLQDINTPTHNSGTGNPNLFGGGILKGQGRLTIDGGSYGNIANKLTIVVRNNGSSCTNCVYNNYTAYKFEVVCPDCEPSDLTLLCEELFIANNLSGANLNIGEYTDFTIDITNNICNSNKVYFAIDYDNVNVIDKIKVFYNNVVVGETPYVGSTCFDLHNNGLLVTPCDNLISTYNNDCYQNGFYMNTNLNPDPNKNTNPTSITSIPILNPLHFSNNDEGAGRLVIDIPYVNGVNTATIRYINNSDNSCGTYWKTMLRCLDCPTVETCCLNTLICPIELVNTESTFILTIDNVTTEIDFTYESGDTVTDLVTLINNAIIATGVTLEIIETSANLQNNYGCSSPNNELVYTLLKIIYPCTSTIDVTFNFTNDYYSNVNNTTNIVNINEENYSCSIEQLASKTCDELLTCTPLQIRNGSCCVINESHPYKVIYEIAQDNNHCLEDINNFIVTSSSGVSIAFLNENDIPLPSCRTHGLLDTTNAKYIIIFLNSRDTYNIQFTCCGVTYNLNNNDVFLLQPIIAFPLLSDFCEGQTIDLYFTSNLAGTVFIPTPDSITTLNNLGLTLNANGNLTGTINIGTTGSYQIEVYGEFGGCTSVSAIYIINITNCGSQPFAEVDVNFGDENGISLRWEYDTDGGAKIVVNGGYGVYSSYLTNKSFESIFVTYDNYANTESSMYNNVSTNYNQPYMPFSYLDGSTNYLYDTSTLPDPAPLTYTVNPVPNPVYNSCTLSPTTYNKIIQQNLGGNTLIEFEDRYLCVLPLTVGYTTVQITSNAACNTTNSMLSTGELQYPIGTTINNITILQKNKYDGIAQVIPINITRDSADSIEDFKANVINALNLALNSMLFTQRNVGVDTLLVAFDPSPLNPNSFTISFYGEIWENAPQIINVSWSSPSWTYDVNGDLIGYYHTLNSNLKGCNTGTCTNCSTCPDCIIEPAWTELHNPRFTAYTICYTVTNDSVCNSGSNEVIQAIKRLNININPYTNNLTYTIINNVASLGIFDSKRYNSSTTCSGMSQYDCRQNSNTLDVSGNLIISTC